MPGHQAFILADTALLRRAGGVPALEDDEVRLACVDRGIDTAGRDDMALRAALQRWIGILEQADGSPSHKDGLILSMLALLPEDNWHSWAQYGDVEAAKKREHEKK